MELSQSNLLHLLNAGNIQAISDLVEHSFQSKGIAAKIALKNNCLQIMLEAAEVPNQKDSITYTQKILSNLKNSPIQKIKVYGREFGEEFPVWQEEFETAQLIPNVLELAVQGDISSINRLIEQWIDSPNIRSKASLKNHCLRIMLASDDVSHQKLIMPIVVSQIKSLRIQNCNQLKISGYESGDDFPNWYQEFCLEEVADSKLLVLQEEGALVLEKVKSELVQEKEIKQPSSVWNSLFGAVAGASNAIGGAAAAASGSVVNTVAGVTEAASHAVGQVGGVVSGTAVGVAGAVGNAALHATDSVGYVLDMVTSSPHLQELSKVLKMDWLIKVVDRVDIVRAETHVKNLQRKYPDDKASQIAHRIMLEKAIYVGSSGFASSLMPGFAAAMFAVDLAATTALQAEMIYQIACAYGLSLKDPARKGEVLAIFGLALGGNSAIRAGLGFVRNVPVAGAVIGASSNSVLLYTLGYAACRFYEAKLNPLSSQENLQASLAESEKYLQSAIAQEVIMDQILVHIVLAGNPGKTWEQILPELQMLKLSPASLEAISSNLKSPPPLEDLIQQIDKDFAVSLIAQCQKVAQMDGVINPEEAAIIAYISKRLKMSLTLGMNR
jgi:uncharacterized protein (DUF697 family)